MVRSQEDAQGSVIILQPNRSASWQQTRRFLYLLGGVTLLVAIIWAFAGAWLVIPFAGLEVAVLAYVMFRVSYSTYQKQVITVEKHQVTLEQGVDSPSRHKVFQRPDVYVSVVEARNPVDTISLELVQGEQRESVGEFLNQADLTLTREALKKAGLMVCSDKWWQSSKM